MDQARTEIKITAITLSTIFIQHLTVRDHKKITGFLLFIKSGLAAICRSLEL